MSIKTFELPRGKRIADKIGNTLVLAPKGRRKRRLSAKHRRAISAAAKRFKIPIITGAAVGVPLLEAYNFANVRGGTTADKVSLFGKRILQSYTGIDVGTAGVEGHMSFNFRDLARGWGPLFVAGLALTISRGMGLQQRVGRLLGRLKLPISFS